MSVSQTEGEAMRKVLLEIVHDPKTVVAVRFHDIGFHRRSFGPACST